MPKAAYLRVAAGFCAAFLASMAAPASAAKWMVIGSEPDPAPHRSVYVMSADEAWIFERFADGFDKVDTDRSPNLKDTLESHTIHSVIVLQVFENAGGTNFISYTVDFKCQEGLVSIPAATSYDRAGKPETGGSPDWMKVPDNWLGKAEMIACGWKNWQSAKQVLGTGGAPEPASKRKKKKEPAASFESLGMQYLGEANYFQVTDVIDVVWNTLWTDAVQPAYYEGTAEEKAAVNAKLAALRDQTRGVMAEQEKWSKISIELTAKAERIGGAFGSDMMGVGGLTEAEVMARWGAPQNVSQQPGVRTVTYYFQDTQYGVDNVQVDILGDGGKVGETYETRLATSQRQCARTLYLMEGGAVEKAYRVFDFDIGCG